MTTNYKTGQEIIRRGI